MDAFSVAEAVGGEFRKFPEFLSFFSLIPSSACATFSLFFCERAPTIYAARKGGTSVGRIPAKVGSLWSLRVWGLRLEISGQAEFFPGPCFF